LPTDNEFTRILQWPGYRFYGQIDDKNKTLDLWVRRKRGNRKLALFSPAHAAKLSQHAAEVYEHDACGRRWRRLQPASWFAGPRGHASLRHH